MHNLTSFSFLHKRYHDNNAPVDLVFGVYSLNISIFFGDIYAHLRLLYASIRTLTRVLVFFLFFCFCAATQLHRSWLASLASVMRYAFWEVLCLGTKIKRAHTCCANTLCKLFCWFWLLVLVCLGNNGKSSE